MLLPLLGFIFFIVFYYCIGAILLKFIPAFKYSKINVLIFLFGAWVGTILSGYTYTHMFADANDQLTSSVAVLGFFITLFISGSCVGLLAVLFGNQIIKYFKAKAADED